MNLSRRNFLQLGAAVGTLAAVGGRSVVSAAELTQGGKSFSKEKKERQVIPTSCFQCPAICGLVAYVENGKIVKVEGNPAHPNNKGRACAKGQASANQAYDAQRILYPMKQTKERGDRTGWVKISWDEAFKTVGERIKKHIDAGTPEKVFVMPGRDRSAGYLARFATAIGTPHQIGRSGTCSQSKKEGFKEIYGYDSGVPHVGESKYILNFGQGVLESGSTFVGTALRVMESMAKGAKMTTIDPRLSMTAAKSTEWVPIKPGTDLAMALAMQYVIIKENLVDPKMVKWFNYPLDKYLEYLTKQGYTPEWAEKITGVPAATIVKVAKEWATIKPGTVFAYKGTGTHTNGAQTSKAILLLAALVGNLNVPGGFLYSDTAKYKSVGAAPPAVTKKKHVATKSSAISPDASTLVPTQIAAAGIVDTYITWVHNPVFVLGDNQKQIDTLKDRKKIPFFVAIDLFMSESAELADIILPDVSFLERWDPESHYPIDGVPWVAIRQPVITPIGEGKEQCEILRGIAKAISPDVYKYFELSRKDYVKEQLNADVVPGFLAWGGYEKLLKVGAYVPAGAKPSMMGYAEKEVKETDLKDSIFDEKSKIYYAVLKDKEGKVVEKDGKPQPDTAKPLGIKLADGKVYKGWKTTSLMVNLFTKKWEDAYPGEGLPKWTPSTQAKEGEFLAFPYKYATLTHSRTSNCKWLSEIRHDNPVLMNAADAAKLGVKTGDVIKLTSEVNAKEFTVEVTEGVMPGTLGVGWGPGHWAYGSFATAGKDTKDAHGKDIGAELVKADKDYGRIWWQRNGTNFNWLPPLKADLIGGAQEYTVAVKAQKA